MEKNKSNKLFIGIIAALAVVIIGLVIFIVAGGKEKKNDVTTATTADNQVTEATATDSHDENKTEATTEADKEDSNPECYVTITAGNNWESGGKFAGQLDAKIYNNTSSQIKNWTIEIPVGEGATVDSSWNGNFEIKDGKLIITAVEYNQTVEASGTLGDIGFIVSVNSKEDFNAMTQNAKLLVDGKEYVASTGSSDSGSDKKEESTEAADASTTEEEKVDAQTPAKPESGTPFENHGKLSVKGTDIVDEKGNLYQLKGVSTHGLAWFPDYVNKEGFKTFRDDWDANLIRLAMYTHENGGYCTDGNKENLKNLVDKGVNYATELGMYVIVDWHILHDLNPQVYKEEAKVFFQEMSAKYKDYDNVIYEICNEPNGGTSWADVKSYAEEIIPIIRKNAPDAIIIVGTPNWSQDVDIAAQDPITGYDNIMYAAHFYAATHTDNIRSKVQTALDAGLPVFISEFSICDASGNGAIDYGQADKWFELINSNNMSYAGWNISNKDETSSLIKPSCSKTSGWTEDELSETGIWLRKTIRGE